MTMTANTDKAKADPGTDEGPKPYVNPYVAHPDEVSLCGFGQTFLAHLSQMVNQYQIGPQMMIEALTPPPEVRAAILRAQAADIMEMAQQLEDEAAGKTDEDGKPKWNSKWKQ